MSAVILAQVFSCWFMTGVIWLVQVLIYPNYKFVGQKEFENFHEFHMNRITWIVAPMMGIELFSAIWLLWNHPDSIYWINSISIALIWCLTAFVNVPTHRVLTFEIKKTKRLVAGNWPRTILWTIRSSFWLFMLNSMMKLGAQ